MRDEEDRKGTVVMGSNAMPSAAVAMLLLVLQGAADAQEAGSFRSLQSYDQDYTTMDHAGGAVTGGSLVGTSTVMESSGPPFVVGETSVARCLVLARTLRDGFVELESPCTFTDGIGDKIYFLARRKDGNVAEGGGGEGRAEIVGGTGKYAGVSGECNYVTRYLPVKHVDTSSKCTWQRP